MNNTTLLCMAMCGVWSASLRPGASICAWVWLALGLISFAGERISAYRAKRNQQGGAEK